MCASPVIGLLGVGAIGGVLGRRIASAGLELVVYDTDPARCARLGDAVRVAASAAEVGDAADIVLSCLSSAPAHRSAVLGPEGVHRGSRWRTYVHTGTSGRAVLYELAEPLRSNGVAILDAPISGGPTNAARGALTTVASGDRAALDAAQAAIRSYSSQVFYLGERLGAAQTLKLVNNFLLAANLVSACEALVLGQRAGFAGELVLDVINHGSGVNSATLRHLPEYVLPRQFAEGGTIGLMLKDLHLAMDEAQALEVPTALSRKVIDIFTQAGEQLGFDAHFASIVQMFE